MVELYKMVISLNKHKPNFAPFTYAFIMELKWLEYDFSCKNINERIKENENNQNCINR